MYTLYYRPHTCSLATHTVLNILNQKVNTIDKNAVADFSRLNPVNSVPVLQDGDLTLTEGAAILMYLLDKHDNSLLPRQNPERQQAIENILFANATMHPAYGRLFFAAENLPEGSVKDQFMRAAAQKINRLWEVVEAKLENGSFLGGSQVTAADILLAVYSRWGQLFPISIVLGERATNMVDQVTGLSAFQAALKSQDPM